MAVAVPATTGESSLAAATIYPRFDVAAFIDAADRTLAAHGYHVDSRPRDLQRALCAAGCAVGQQALRGRGGSPAVQTILLDIDCCMDRPLRPDARGGPLPASASSPSIKTPMWRDDAQHPLVRVALSRARRPLGRPDGPRARALRGAGDRRPQRHRAGHPAPLAARGSCRPRALPAPD